MKRPGVCVSKYVIIDRRQNRFSNEVKNLIKKSIQDSIILTYFDHIGYIQYIFIYYTISVWWCGEYPSM
jgi:hypothetical protein